MSNLAIDGLVSGFDTSAIVDSILQARYLGPIDQFEERIGEETEKYNSLTAVSANLLNLEISVSSLKSTSLFSGKKISSSNPNIVNASASNAASTGNFSLRVDNLAKSDQISSDVFVSRTDELSMEGKFVINGRTIDISNDDSLSSIATQINAANAGVNASVVQLAPSQNRLVLNATETGVDKIELREVGTDNILSDLGLISSDVTAVTYDRTVNANNEGALSNAYAPGFMQTYTGETFTIGDAGGQYDISVTLNAVNMTLQDIADEINASSTAAGANISASVILDGTDERLAITSTSGIPQEFIDQDNVLFNLGVLGGIQSAAYTSKSKTVGDLMDLGATNTSSITLEDGDGSDSFSFDIDLDTDTLQNIVDRINTEAGAAGSDITAQVIQADGFSRIEINSGTGKVNILADSENALQTLGLADRDFKNYDQQGENSQVTFNGLTVNRTSNLISDLQDGVSLALITESTDFVNISIREDYSNVEGVVQSFVDAFNTLENYLGEQTFYDSDSGSKGTLFGNDTIRDLERVLAGGISRSIPNLPGVKVSELNEGKGIDLGKIDITDRKGTTFSVDLTGVQTVQDVIDAINYTEGITVKAEFSSSGTALKLTDQSGGTGVFQVEEVNGGTTAEDLGLKKRVYSNNIAGSPIHESGAQSLSSIGITLNEAGTLTFDSSKLQSALNEDPDLVKNLIQASGIGFASHFGKIVTDFTAYGTGRMSSTTQAVTDRIEQYLNQIERYEERAASYETVLRRQFTALEVTMSKSQQVSQYLSQYLSVGDSK